MKYIQYLSTTKLVLLISIVLISCSSNKKFYKIKWNSKYPLILYKSEKEDVIYRFRYPIKIVLKNNSFKTKEILGFEYFYANGSSGYLSLNREENGSLKKLRKISRKLYMFQEKEFILYINNHLNLKQISQNHFKAYIEKMALEKKDTLHILLDDFRNNNPKLLKQMTNGNKISINTKKEVIFIPADWEDK